MNANTDRELLELAAKAAGITPKRWTDEGATVQHSLYPPGVVWNPLKSDGDALRLAFALGLHVEFRPWAVCVWKNRKQFPSYGGDQCCDMQHARLAITRAAAEIGKAMP